VHLTSDYLAMERPLFEKVYTISFENYPVDLERLRRPDVRATGARR